MSRCISNKYLRGVLVVVGIFLVAFLVYFVSRPLFAVRGQYETVGNFFSESDVSSIEEDWELAYPMCGPFFFTGEARNPYNGRVLEVDYSWTTWGDVTCCDSSPFALVYKDPRDNLFWVQMKTPRAVSKIIGGGDVYGPFEYETDDEEADVDLQRELSSDEAPLIGVYGDSRSGHTMHQAIVDRMGTYDLDAVFHTGDLVADGSSDADWATFNSITADLRASFPFYPAIGNHEGDGVKFTENFDLPNNERWYSVTIGSGYFIILDTTSDISVGSAQYTWLENELMKAASTTESVFVLFHHPAFNTGAHPEDEAGLQEDVVPLFEEFGVDIAFSGHDHTYERSFNNGIYYITTGGAGAPLYDQARQADYSQKYLKEYHFCVLELLDDETASMTVYDENGVLLDSIQVDTDDGFVQRELF